MKILMVLFEIQDYGGIINHAECLALGLKRKGCEVDFNMLASRQSVSSHLAGKVKNPEEFTVKGTGYPYHQTKGWSKVPKIPYLSLSKKKQFLERCSREYDAVLWHMPVPTRNNENKDIDEWLSLYNNGCKNIAIVHDGNLPDLYPHILAVKDKFWAMVCVHEAAYASAENVPIPRKLIVNPFDFAEETKLAQGGELELPWEGEKFNQRDGFVAIQIFKAWKRVDSLIRAIPQMQNNESKIIGGAGIEYRYMTSKEKCKPKYFELDGTRIWNNALDAGMDYVGVQKGEQVFEHLYNAKLHIDPSWSIKYSNQGAHFNRTTIEAMFCGAVPMATDLGMKNSAYFKAGQNFIEIPHKASAVEFANIVDQALADEKQWSAIRKNNIPLLRQFCCEEVADEYIDLIEDNQAETETGEVSDELLYKAEKSLKFFGINPHNHSLITWY
ncbi:MAG: hypothetical protein CMC15_18475 [Flavobacteriaceae bacterium]|nr:hypothetical protein [Flavobacteriaceae bacterium]